MAEEAEAAVVEPVDEAANAEPAPDAQASPAPTGTIDGGGNAPDDGGEQPKGSLETLRETLAGGDEALLKQLNRYKSPEAISKAFREARAAAQKKQSPFRLGENASEDEVKAYREALGIPENPGEYPVAFRDDFPAADVDKEMLPEFRNRMHKAGVDPKAASEALEFYQDLAIARTQDAQRRAVETTKKTQAELRAEWGGEFDGNIGAIRELMTAQLGADGFEQMMGLRLEDGTLLQDQAPFVKMLAQIATDYYGSNAIYSGDVEATTKTVEDKLADFDNMQMSDPDKYWSAPVQAEVKKLHEQKLKLNSRRAA
jgi:hypothetical protein